MRACWYRAASTFVEVVEVLEVVLLVIALDDEDDVEVFDPEVVTTSAPITIITMMTTTAPTTTVETPRLVRMPAFWAPDFI